MAKDINKKQRQKVYKELSHERFIKQRKMMFLPCICYLAVSAILFCILLFMDTPQILFDDTSKAYTIPLLIMTVVPLVSLVIIYFANKTTHLLITMLLQTLTIFPLLYGFWLKYDGLKKCSSYHMLLFYFLYFIVFIVMTTVYNKIRNKHMNYSDEL